MSDEKSAQFTERVSFSARFGSVRTLVREAPATLLVLPAGFVTPSLVRRELELAREFGAEHADGWDYVVDTTAVRAVHPWNLTLLRGISALPNVAHYYVVAPALLPRLAIEVVGRLIGLDRVVRSPVDLELGLPNPS